MFFSQTHSWWSRVEFMKKTRVFYSSSAAAQLTEDLRNIAAWCCKNSLLINPDKTKLLVLGTPQLLMKIPDDLSITLLSKEITSSKSAKNLGVTMDCNLTYDEHVTQLNFEMYR